MTRNLTVGAVTMGVLAGCTALLPVNFAGDPAGATGTGGALATGVVRIGDHTFQVEIADTASSRSRGLMERTTLAEDEGMLFIFERPSALSFWMFNTPLPLDIAFIREDMTVSSIDTMAPFSIETHRSVEPVRFALEVPAGEFTHRGIGPGDTVVFEGIDTVE